MVGIFGHKPLIYGEYYKFVLVKKPVYCYDVSITFNRAGYVYILVVVKWKCARKGRHYVNVK